MIPCLFNLGTGEIIIILVVVLLLFGAKRIPELARGLGRGVNSFRKGLNEVTDQIDDIDTDKSGKN
ncbi:MAG: twin-arginine translocase TatA/TatE family subunit [Duncaniella sp.]|jgi:sec-independent protein translocase protein TatA|uniref:Sec-independent protein translocase subunit TatA/TatB n=1 Tax=Duncaniella muricolitica TaxID=2880704 RepID=UPI0023D2387A|nr:twin-arginine translocase TatA/TatE family subunit [Duncaniella muricolitica]MCX4368849.1 twin-arginine translocase TatA/TatE family subunit [Duncaniella sp.]MDE5927014.1 twin-arginine translocase TatA/TatE family subunit [Duncaniella sp.]